MELVDTLSWGGSDPTVVPVQVRPSAPTCCQASVFPQERRGFAQIYLIIPATISATRLRLWRNRLRYRAVTEPLQQCILSHSHHAKTPPAPLYALLRPLQRVTLNTSGGALNRHGGGASKPYTVTVPAQIQKKEYERNLCMMLKHCRHWSIKFSIFYRVCKVQVWKQ